MKIPILVALILALLAFKTLGIGAAPLVEGYYPWWRKASPWWRTRFPWWRRRWRYPYYTYRHYPHYYSDRYQYY